jgi:hypothetical protein
MYAKSLNNLVAKGGIEPPTRGFSVLRRTLSRPSRRIRSESGYCTSGLATLRPRCYESALYRVCHSSHVVSTFGLDFLGYESVNRHPMRQHSIDVAERIRALPHLGIEALQALWIELYGQPPRFPARRELIVPMLAYRLQEMAYGGLSAATRKRLRAFVDGIDARGPRPSRPAARLKAGTRLIREWKGETHVASVLENGVEYRGKRYRSLSEVARAITGTRWSGPAFFGLKSARVSAERRFLT